MCGWIPVPVVDVALQKDMKLNVLCVISIVCSLAEIQNAFVKVSMIGYDATNNLDS